MVWARGHKNDFDHWAKESGDKSWGYHHVLDTYKRIEDWHGAPDPTRRGRGGKVFVQPAPDPSPLARLSAGSRVRRDLGLRRPKRCHAGGTGRSSDHKRSHPRWSPAEHRRVLPLPGYGPK